MSEKTIEVRGRIAAPPEGWEYCGYGHAALNQLWFDGICWWHWNGALPTRGVYPLARRIADSETTTEPRE